MVEIRWHMPVNQSEWGMKPNVTKIDHSTFHINLHYFTYFSACGFTGAKINSPTLTIKFNQVHFLHIKIFADHVLNIF